MSAVVFLYILVSVCACVRVCVRHRYSSTGALCRGIGTIADMSRTLSSAGVNAGAVQLYAVVFTPAAAPPASSSSPLLLFGSYGGDDADTAAKGGGKDVSGSGYTASGEKSGGGDRGKFVDDAPAPTMQIFIRYEGKPYTVDVSPGDRVEAVRLRVQRKTYLPPDQQCLVYVSKELLNGRTLADYNVTRECTLQLTGRFPPASMGTLPVLRHKAVHPFAACEAWVPLVPPLSEVDHGRSFTSTTATAGSPPRPTSCALSTLLVGLYLVRSKVGGDVEASKRLLASFAELVPFR
jgi:large subunit ribosomal protein L40e